MAISMYLPMIFMENGRNLFSWILVVLTHPSSLIRMADAIIPVPLHKTREKQRGYNQAALIARELGKRLNIPVEEEFVGRIRQTLPQKNLKGKERQNNLKNAFKIRQNDVKLNTVIVVDDIYTTGTTMDEIAGCLKRAGIREIYCISLAVGRGI